jgi:hypothetical protein
MEEQKNIWKRKYLKVFTLFSIIGIIVGAIAGYIYYIKVGCTSGSCAISSNPYVSMAWGMAMGYLLGDMFNVKPKKNSSKSS